jgi:hypothetical protein
MISDGKYSLLISTFNMENINVVSMLMLFKPLLQQSLLVSFHSGIHFRLNTDCHYYCLTSTFMEFVL